VQELDEHLESIEWITERFSKPDMGKLLENLGMLFDREYWKRIWIVQELIVAKETILYCGENSIKAKCLYAVQQLFRRMADLDGFSTDLILVTIRD
jgi:hypothetical protein